ncbi:MAG: ABC transporter permease [Acidobacteriia bacterium]|nr:ABC transporter permease [Terriglobia bacterium]
MNTLLQDLRYGIRMLVKSPGFTAIAVLTLALGIGANSIIFSSVNAMLLRPFPFQDLDRTVAIWETAPKQDRFHVAVAPANFRDWREQSKTLELMSAGHGWSANLNRTGFTERVEGYQVTSDFFQLLGITPQIGRTIGASDYAGDHSRVVVLSHGLWQRSTGGDAQVVGKTLLLNGESFTVIGVMPADFDFPVGTEVWAPLALNASEQADRADHYLQVMGRLKSGVSKAQAEAEMAQLAGSLAQQFPQTNAGHSVRLVGLVEDLTSGSRQFLMMLLGAAAFVLILACANVANLQMARATVRQKEMAVRRALGAGRGRILRQLLVENLILATLGGVAGLLLSSWGLEILRRDIPAFILQRIPGLKHLQVESRVLLFTLMVSFVAGVVVGLAPAFQGSQLDLNGALKDGGRDAASAPVSHRLRSVLVVAEVALALVLLVGAGLMVKGFRHLLNTNSGFDRSNILTFRVVLPHSEYPDNARIVHFYAQLMERLRALPHVNSAAAVTVLPSGWGWNQTLYRAEDQPPAAPGEFRVAGVQSVTPEFLQALRVPLVEGRFFSRTDGAESPPVIVLSQSLVRRIWPDQDAIGRRLKFGMANAEGPWHTVVGVVGDIRQSQFDTEPNPTAYFPLDQLPPPSAGIMLRVPGDPIDLASEARAQVRSVDPNVSAYDIRTLEQVISDDLSGVEISSRLMMAFGAVALLLAAAGIFALMAFSVTQRTHEIGVRIALGAQPGDVIGMLVGRAMKLAVIGLAIGVPLVFALTKAVSSALFGTLAMDTRVLFAITVLLAGVAALAGYIPARRATKVDPMEALRYE